MAVTDIDEVRRLLIRLRCDLASLRLSRLEMKYRPKQPRAPAGSPEGGRWIDDAGGASAGAHVDDGVFRPNSDGDPVLTQAGQPTRPAVDLRSEGGGGQHAIEKHVAKSDAELKASLESGDIHGTFETAYEVRPVGSFESIGSANAYVNDVLGANSDLVAEVASGKRTVAYLEQRYSSPTGREAYRRIFLGDFVSVGFRPTFSVAVVIAHSASGRGYRLITTFPKNKEPDKD